MPDPVVTPEVTPASIPGPAPAIDPVAFAKMVKDEVAQYMSTTDKDMPAAGYVPPVATENPLKAVIDPIVGPSINRARLEGLGARNAVVFFASHPEAVKYAKELNQAFDTSMSQGTPYDYDTLWAWFRGRPENFDKFVKEGIDAEKTKLAQANEATTVEGGVRLSATGPVQAESLTHEDLSAKLKDVVF